MQIFLDTGDVETIRKANETGLIDGVTTNPTHMVKTGRSFKEVVREICSTVSGPVSVEAVADTADGLVEEAVKIAALAQNVVVKIPMTVEGLKAVPILERAKSIKTNVTMVFSSTQPFLAMKAGVDIATVGPQLFFQMFKHPLTDVGLVQFPADWEKVPK